ncbi:MAG: hypothetical protein BMS9Abin10_0834 [Gammaproteobacteria bacterium]|nr:MAG: hypothetical protein BMS9Abin10_0834 [Gammaproteobacteria bacterium]
MNDKLFTQCPSCETTFALTPAQLEARDGLVRCGACTAVFRADQHMRQPRTDATPVRSTGPAAPGGERRAHGQARASAPAPSADIDPEHDGAPHPDEFVTSTLASFLIGKRRGHTHAAFWLLGVVVLMAALLGQTVFFYATELSRYPPLAPWVKSACERLGCKTRPQQDVGLIDILRTSVTRHPTHARALRIQASLVNRADFSQPFPRMEVTLTNNIGVVIGRRTFSAREYLKSPAPAAGDMPPRVVIESLLDINKPEPGPGGYEIRLLPG